MKKEKLKVLHVIMSMNMGGIETLLMNLLRKLDRNKYQFDFLTWYTGKDYYSDEIKKYGSNVYKINITHNPIKDIKEVKKFLENNKYDVVHAHSLFYSAIFILAAKLAKVKVRVSHFHSFSDNKGNSLYRKLYKGICRFILNKYSTVRCACSNEAAIYGYGIKKSKNVIIINNCIDVDKYINVKTKSINDIKKKYNIQKNDVVIGSVARLSVEKNQQYIIKILAKLVKKNKNVKCLLVGNGDEKKNLISLAKKNKVFNNIIFAGEVDNVPDYLKAMDVFLFPSLYEGFGLALLEAQAAGVYCLSSDTVPRSTDMDLDLVKYLSISDENIDSWVNEILNHNISVDNKRIKENIINKGFDISVTLENIINIYEKDYRR